jgi:tRNA(His) 5'-end guanylyltransferase
MRRDEFEALGDLHKQYESLGGDVLMPNLPFAVRLDGKSFHTFTMG